MTAPSLSCLRALRLLVTHHQPRSCLYMRTSRMSSSKATPTPTTPPSSAAPKTMPTKAERLVEPSRDQRKAGPQPLSHPLGVPDPPQAGENWGVDLRSLKQRRDDFVDHKKHIERRSRLAKTLFRPYFKDFNDMRFHKGKVFLAPERPFKAQYAQYFPNLHGLTLDGTLEADTTPVLEGRVSVVTLTSSGWAEKQTKSFVGEEENTGLQGLLDHVGEGRVGEGEQRAQLVEINYEPNAFKYWIVKLFRSGLRAARDKARWGNYFLVRKGFDQDLRLSVGMSNQKVGHVYLLDRACRIRWAGHAQADDAERNSLVVCLQRLLREGKETRQPLESSPGLTRRDSAVSTTPKGKPVA